MAACGPKPQMKFKEYDGPPVTRVELFKEARILRLISGKSLVKQYDVELGFAPVGHKEQEGDGKTPVGAYLLDRRNPNSRFHLSVGVSYPNRDDIARAEAMGVKPGGDIFIHGTPQNYLGQSDWTWGCIAVTNDEIEDIYAMVKNGTPIYIYN